jgi:hypothetical protein
MVHNSRKIVMIINECRKTIHKVWIGLRGEGWTTRIEKNLPVKKDEIEIINQTMNLKRAMRG